MREIAEIVSHIQQGQKVCFIIGAGASHSAGIPTANGLMELVKKKHSHCLIEFSEQDKANYGKVMSAIPQSDREKIIRPRLEKSRINWGHIALATLAREEHIERVLTFNFDLILERAVSLLGFQMPVYDFVAANTTNIKRIAGSSILHLHGQGHGLELLNSDTETEPHKEKLRPLLADTINNYMTIVIGYSGEADGAFDVILDEFDTHHRLFWFGHSDQAPPHLKPLFDTDFAKYIGGSDFDQTMMEIARELKIWPPAIFENPMQHLLEELSDVTDFPVQKDTETEVNVLTTTRERLDTYAQNWEKDESPDARANSLLLSGTDDFGEVERLTAHIKDLSNEARNALSWVSFNTGDNFAHAARLWTGDQAASEFSKAYKNFQKALEFMPNNYWALNNWGFTLSEEAKVVKGTERANKLAEANSKFKQALEIKPDDPRVLANWGFAISDEAKVMKGTERANKFAKASSKFKRVQEMKPGDQQVLVNWGFALSEEAKVMKGAERANKFAEATGKFKQALEIRPDNYEILNNWGTTLAIEANELSGKERTKLFANASSKFKQALEIKPNNRRVLYDWGVALTNEAIESSGKDRANKLANAKEKFVHAKKLFGKSFYYLARIFALTGDVPSALAELQACRVEGSLPDFAFLISDTNLDSLRENDEFVELLESIRP